MDSEFTITGSVDVTIRDPNGTVEKADVRFNHDKNLSYSVSYVPRKIGGYKIFVTFLGKDIPNSPFSIDVAEKAGDASKVKASGPGLRSDDNHCGKSTYFDIITEGQHTQCNHFIGIPDIVNMYIFSFIRLWVWRS